MNNSFDFLINNLTPEFLLSWNTILQAIIILSAVGISFFSNEAIKKYFISKSVKKVETILSGVIRIVSPLVMLIVLYITNAVQEEVGLRGAEMIANTLKPDVAIVTDVCHDTTTPMINQKEQGFIEMGKGPVVSYAPAVQNKLREKILNTAAAKEIPFQRLASSRYTGTDTDAFAYSNGGVASALISLPLRYMHTTVEMVHKDDVENVIRMIYETLLEIKPEENFSYFD
mgnify:CR=1 FL=1